jgi:hypothetical protein
MPVSYSFDDRIAVMRMEGNYSVAELEDAVLAGLADPARPNGVVLMFDLRESRALRDRPTEDVRAMARFLSRNREKYNSRLAMVAPTDLAYGLMRLGAVTAEAGGVAAEVFRDFASARAWLLGGRPSSLAARAAGEAYRVGAEKDDEGAAPARRGGSDDARSW